MALPVSGFMPLPIPYMIPFMASQSMVMGDAFGRGYQMGKRRISSMSNEQFNAYTHTQLMIDIHQDIRAAIPSMKQGMINMDEYTKFVIDKMLEVIPNYIKHMAVGPDNSQSIQHTAETLGGEAQDILGQLAKFFTVPEAHASHGSDGYKWQAPPPPPANLPDWMKMLIGKQQGPPDKTKERDTFMQSGQSTPLPWQSSLDKIGTSHNISKTQQALDKLRAAQKLLAAKPPPPPKDQRTATTGGKTYTYTVKKRGSRSKTTRKQNTQTRRTKTAARTKKRTTAKKKAQSARTKKALAKHKKAGRSRPKRYRR